MMFSGTETLVAQLVYERSTEFSQTGQVKGGGVWLTLEKCHITFRYPRRCGCALVNNTAGSHGTVLHVVHYDLAAPRSESDHFGIRFIVSYLLPVRLKLDKPTRPGFFPRTRVKLYLVFRKSMSAIQKVMSAVPAVLKIGKSRTAPTDIDLPT
jgi:hypothetical protein